MPGIGHRRVGRAANTGMLGRIKAILRKVLSRHVQWATRPPPPQTPLFVKMKELSGKCVTEIELVGPWEVFKSSLRFRLFQEVLSDFSQVEVATPSEAHVVQQLCLLPSPQSQALETRTGVGQVLSLCQLGQAVWPL